LSHPALLGPDPQASSGSTSTSVARPGTIEVSTGERATY